jgi:hypothetical protein
MSGSYRTVNTADDRSNVQSFSIGRSNEAEIIRFKRYKMIKNKICGTLSLCVFGVVLVIVGFYWMIINRAGYIPFLLLGLLSLIPGSYGAYEVRCVLVLNISM